MGYWSINGNIYESAEEAERENRETWNAVAKGNYYKKLFHDTNFDTLVNDPEQTQKLDSVINEIIQISKSEEINFETYLALFGICQRICKSGPYLDNINDFVVALSIIKVRFDNEYQKSQYDSMKSELQQYIQRFKADLYKNENRGIFLRDSYDEER